MFKNLFRKKFDPLSKRDKSIVVAVPSVVGYKKILVELLNDIDNYTLARTGFKETVVAEFLVDKEGYVIDNSFDVLNDIYKMAKKIDKYINKNLKSDIKQIHYKKLLVSNALNIYKELSN